jgi:hypothetical protein
MSNEVREMRPNRVSVWLALNDGHNHTVEVGLALREIESGMELLVCGDEAMGRLSSFKPRINSIQDAERITIRCLGAGSVSIILGFLLLWFVDPTIGGILAGFGGLLVFGGLAWVAYGSKAASVARICPRCRQSNHVFAGDPYLKCSGCGHISVVGEM